MPRPLAVALRCAFRARFAHVCFLCAPAVGAVSCAAEQAPSAAVGPARPAASSSSGSPEPPTVTFDRAPARPRRAGTEPPPSPATRIATSPSFALRPCSEEGQIRSLFSNDSLLVAITNLTHEDLHVYWLGFDGGRVKYAKLAPDQGYEQQTFVTHPWIFVDAKERCLGIVVPTSAPQGEKTITVVAR